MTAPEAITVTRTVTLGRHTLTGTLTATPAQLKAGAAALARLQRPPAYDLRCGKGHGDLSSHMKAGDPCRWDEGECGSVLEKVAS